MALDLGIDIAVYNRIAGSHHGYPAPILFPPPLVVLTLQRLLVSESSEVIAMGEAIDLTPLKPKEPMHEGEHHLYTDPSTGIQLFATAEAGKITGWRATDADGQAVLTTFMRPSPSMCTVCTTPPTGLSCIRNGSGEPCGPDPWRFNKPSRCYSVPCYLIAD